ncbi:hypothetical protein V6N11_030666 [Hibiscus sabdariffa]|uniref:Uncharacterized protein n=2 Tax=Hibiscus sabdariffa TaxID=183260 RepID=A0ABR2NMG4_9ROSI
MEKLIHHFVWGSSNVTSGLPLVKWETIQKPIEDGGLGFKNLHQQNMTFLLKIGYQFVCDVDKLWVQVLRAKYKWEETLSLEITWSNSSRLWKGLSDVWSSI